MIMWLTSPVVALLLVRSISIEGFHHQYSSKSQHVALYMGRRPVGAPKIDVNAKIDFTNFYLRSIATFTPCDRPDRKADYVSWSGSSYWNMGHYVIRQADHWSGSFGVGLIKECRWKLDMDRSIPNLDVPAKCNYNDFRMIKKKSMKKRKKWSARKNK